MRVFGGFLLATLPRVLLPMLFSASKAGGGVSSRRGRRENSVRQIGHRGLRYGGTVYRLGMCSRARVARIARSRQVNAIVEVGQERLCFCQGTCGQCPVLVSMASKWHGLRLQGGCRAVAARVLVRLSHSSQSDPRWVQVLPPLSHCILFP